MVGSAVATPALAAPTAQEAINDYNAGKYLSCLQKLQALNLKNNATAHYYIALCAQNLNRMTEAKAEYNWVISNGAEPLRGYAQKGLANLDKLHVRPPAATELPAPTDKAEPKKAAVASAAPGVKKIIYFMTTWNRQCNIFKPSFEEAQGHFKDIAFTSMDGDEASSSALKEKYNVSSFPTIVYLDAAGKVLKNEAGAPASTEAFESQINELNGKKEK